jgi:hypothetical protein
MSIDPIQAGFREIPSAVSQLSLTRRDRELLMQEGQPPLEVAPAEQEAMRWQKEEDLRGKCSKRRQQRTDKPSIMPGLSAEDDEASLTQSQPMQTNAKPLAREEAGTLFNGRT